MKFNLTDISLTSSTDPLYFMIAQSMQAWSSNFNGTFDILPDLTENFPEILILKISKYKYPYT